VTVIFLQLLLRGLGVRMAALARHWAALADGRAMQTSVDSYGLDVLKTMVGAEKY